jgi:hypothetical protein
MVQPISSEYKLPAELNGPRRRDGSVPLAESWAGHVRIEALVADTAGSASEDVHIPDIEEFGSKFEAQFLADLRPLENGQVMVVVAEASQVRDPSPFSIVEVETGRVFERRTVQERTIRGIEVALALRKGIRSLQNSGNARGLELPRNVADTRSEEQRRPGLNAGDAVQPPPA